MPHSRASRHTVGRNPTPWTMPVTRMHSPFMARSRYPQRDSAAHATRRDRIPPGLKCCAPERPPSRLHSLRAKRPPPPGGDPPAARRAHSGMLPLRGSRTTGRATRESCRIPSGCRRVRPAVPCIMDRVMTTIHRARGPGRTAAADLVPPFVSATLQTQENKRQGGRGSATGLSATIARDRSGSWPRATCRLMSSLVSGRSACMTSILRLRMSSAA